MTTHDLKEIEPIYLRYDRMTMDEFARAVEESIHDIIVQHNTIIRYLKEHEETHNRNND